MNGILQTSYSTSNLKIVKNQDLHPCTFLQTIETILNKKKIENCVYTGSLFYLIAIISHFLSLIRRVCWLSDKWARLIRQTSRQYVTTNCCQMKY
jgi:hypothetical protein